MPRWRNWYTRPDSGRDYRKIVRHEFESNLIDAAVAELVYAPVLGTGSRKGLGVRVSPAAHEFLILGDENVKGSGNGSFPSEERIENRGFSMSEAT